MICQASKGFLTLSPCENPAVTACAQCGRMMCPAHLAAQTGFSTCLTCAATNPDVQDGEYDGVWASRYRDSYYEDTGYRPVGTSHFDRYDSDSFDETQRDFVEDDRERGGFEGS